ncbi:hypothetical protein ACIBF1_42040 [Spirillospora sp. NPDC050679]
MTTPDPAPELRALLAQAARLVADLDTQHHREQEAFADGYRLGYTAGHQIGHAHGQQQAEREAAADWAYLAARVRAQASRPSHAELETRRYPGHTPERLRQLRRDGAPSYQKGARPA